MSASFHVVGIRGSFPAHQKKREAVIACKAAGVLPPKELMDYFGDDVSLEMVIENDSIGLQIDIKHEIRDSDVGLYHDVLVSDIPKGVEKIRFIYSS